MTLDAVAEKLSGARAEQFRLSYNKDPSFTAGYIPHFSVKTQSLREL